MSINNTIQYNILEMIRPPGRDIFGVHHPDGIKRVFQLRVGLSPLRAHKRSHGFQDTPSGVCLCGGGPEDSAHFLILCPFFSAGRATLFARVVELCCDFLGMTTCERTLCLLYGVHGLSDDSNSVLLNATIDFIFASRVDLIRKISAPPPFLALRALAPFLFLLTFSLCAPPSMMGILSRWFDCCFKVIIVIFSLISLMYVTFLVFVFVNKFPYIKSPQDF